MFDIRIRKSSPDGTRGVVINASTIATSIQESGIATIDFTVSERVASTFNLPFVVALEYSNGGKYQQPRNGLFIVTEEGKDNAESTKTITFTARPYVPWLLEGMHQRAVAYTGATWAGGKHAWPNASPGLILRSLIDTGVAVGWAPMIATDFTATVDSSGAAWTAAEKWSPEFQNLTSISDIFDAHVNNGLIDWWSEGTTLRVFRPGVGASLPNVKLGGPGFTQMPVKQAYDGQFNYLTVVDGDSKWHYFVNTGADMTFGTRHMTMTMAGVKGSDVARLAEPFLLEGRTLRRELSYEWTPAGGMPVPWVTFQVGDGVQARTRDGWVEQRVLGITVTKNSTGVSVRATVGSKLLNRLKQAVQKIDGGSLGQLTGGTGVTVPVVPPAAVAPPAVPASLRVTSNTAVWGEDGSARTSVGFAWDAVTQNTDLEDVDGVSYELWGRLASGASARLTATDALTFTVEGWEPGTARYVKVRALDRNGRTSEFSDEIAVTPLTPASIVPKAPTGLSVTANVAVFQDDGTAVATIYASWDAVTLSVDGAAVAVQEYEVQFAGYAPVRTTTLAAFAKVPSGRATVITVRALSTQGVWSDPSAPLNVTAASPAGSMAAPTAPILDSGMSSVTVRWDGNLTTGVPPAGFGFVYMDIANDEAGPWTTLGTPLIRAGGATVRGHMDETLWVRLRSTDTLGRSGGTSAAVSIVVVGAAGDDIVAGSIEVNHVSPSFGDSLNLQANGSINLLAGRADAAADAITSHQAELDQQAAQLAATQAAAEAAQSGASAAGIAAAAAKAQAAAAQAGVDNIALAVQITTTDVRISRPGAAVALHLGNDQASFRRNGVAQTWWDETQMIVPKVKASQLVVGQTVITEGAGRTTWQRL